VVRRGKWGRDPEALFAQSRHGVITVERLERLGVPSGTCYRRCRPGQPWQRLLPGILLLGTAEPTRRQLAEAALLHGGPDSVITGGESCSRQGLTRLSQRDAVHVLVPDHRKTGSTGFVLVERTTRMPDSLVLEGLRLAPLVRSVLDGCRRLVSPNSVRAALAEAVQRGRISPIALIEELERGSSHGTAIPRAALRELLRGARSVAEGDAMAVWRGTGLPAPSWNFELRTTAGRYVATPDGWFDEVGLAWEIDSYEYHFGRDGYATTLARNARYAAAGVAVVQTLPGRLRSQPAQVRAELVAAYRAAAARPRPSVLSYGRSG